MASDCLPNEAQIRHICEFVTEHFQVAECERYVRVDLLNNKGTNDGIFNADDCGCGRPFEWHAARQIVPPVNSGPDICARRWSPVLDTRRYPCNAFGELLFAPGQGFDSSTIVPGASAFYIRSTPPRYNDSDEYLENIYKLMTSRTLWNLPAPQFIIEIAGTARKLHQFDQEILDRFTTGLIRAANTAKAWIVTSGMNSGVMGLVGDAVSKSRISHSESSITCLGITSWSIVNNRENLVISDLPSEFTPPVLGNGTKCVPKTVELGASSKQSAPYTLPNIMPVYCVQRPENCSNGVPLNPGHNCFLFIDKGKEKRWGEEIGFRAQFLHYLSQKTFHGIGSRGVSTPLVLLVVGGGITTLEMIELSIANDLVFDESDEELDEQNVTEVNIRQNWSRPVVILPHFGGISDLLAYAYEISAVDKEEKHYRHFSRRRLNEDLSQLPPDFDNSIRRHPAFEEILQFASKEMRDEEGVTLIKRIRNCLKHRHLLTIVDLSDDHDHISLDHPILNAILKSNIGSPTSKFELSLLWNRADIAKELLMRHEKEIIQHIDMKAALTRSLMNDQSEFFKLLVEYGLVDLNAYLTHHQIRCFYSDIFLKRRGKAGAGGCVWLFRSLLLNLTTEEALSDVANPHLLHLLGQLLSSLLGCYMDNVFTDEKSYREIGSILPNLGANTLLRTAIDLCRYDTSMRDLFILQLLLHRHDLAIYIWQRGHDHLGTALMAATFLKSLAKEANRLDMTDLGNAYRGFSNEWLVRAVDLLASCYDQEPQICSRLLTRSLLTWQGATILEIAYYGNMKEFMEHPAVQTTLTQVWTGRLATFMRQSLVYLALFPPLLPFLIFRLRFETKRENYAISQPSETPLPKMRTRRNAVVHVGADVGSTIQAPPSLRLMAPFMSSDRHDVKFTRPAIFYCNKEGRISIFKAIYLLYSAPMAKYATHGVFVVGFLFLFSCFLLDVSQERGISGLEIAIWISCIIFFLDVVRDGFGKTNLSVVERMEDFFSDFMVLAEIVGLLLVIVAASLRIFALQSVDSIYSHTIYSVACVIYWLKSMRIFFVTESVGPKVITLFNMLRDLVLIMLIYVTLLLAFSVPIHTLLYPQRHITGFGSYFTALGYIAYDRMWNIFVISMDASRTTVEGTCSASISTNVSSSHTIWLGNSTSALSSMAVNKTRNGETYNPANCSRQNILATALYVTFLLLTNILLLNMLIAMFAHTVDKTRLSSTRLWRFNMYRFLYEYYTRPILPGPLMIFELFYRFIRFINRRTFPSALPENTDLKHFFANLDDYEYRKMEMFERSAGEAVLAAASRGQEETSNGILLKQLRSINDRISNKLDSIEETAVTKRFEKKQLAAGVDVACQTNNI